MMAQVSIIKVLSEEENREVLREEIEKLISAGTLVDEKDTRGWRPTHVAAYNGYDECLELLLKCDVTDPDWIGFEEETALLLACKKGFLSCVKQLLKHKANPDLSTLSGFSPIFEAVSLGNADITGILIDNGADVNKAVYTGDTPLHVASQEGKMELVSFLLEAGAQLDIFTEHHLSPIFMASQYGHYDCLEILLKMAKERGQHNLVNERALDGATPLVLAAQGGYDKCIALLLNYGADANIPVTELNAVPLHFALYKKEFSCLQLLLPPVTDKKNIMSCDIQMHPLHLLLKYDSLKILNELKNMGIDITTSKLPFSEHHAEYIEYIETWGYINFASLPCHFTFVNPNPYIYRHQKRLKFHYKVVKHMLDLGWNPNPEDEKELPPLLCALTKGLWSVAKLLLDHGACPNIYNRAAVGNLVGVTALFADKNISQLVYLKGQGSASDKEQFLLNKIYPAFFCGSDKTKSRTRSIKGKYLLSVILAGGEVASCFNQLSHVHLNAWDESTLCVRNLSGMEIEELYITCLLAFLFSQNISLSAPVEELMGTFFTEKKEFEVSLKSAAESSRTLSHACRKTFIYHLIKSKLIPSIVIPKLEIPHHMKSYLLFEDYSPCHYIIDVLIKYLLDQIGIGSEEVSSDSFFIHVSDDDDSDSGDVLDLSDYEDASSKHNNECSSFDECSS